VLLLAATQGDGSLHSPVVVIVLASVLAPLLVEWLKWLRIPLVVFELLLGISIGPHALNLVQPSGVLDFLSKIGLCFLFFMAGLELDLFKLKGPPLRLAARAWVASLTLALAASALLAWAGLVKSPLMISVALCSTALGTLMPVLRERGELKSRFGSFLLAAGGLGEFGPVLLISVLFSGSANGWVEGLIFLGYSATIAGAGWLALQLRPPALVALLGRTLDTSSQLPIRVCLLLIVVLAYAAHKFGLDLILGAFGAGLMVGRATRDTATSGTLRQKLDSLSFGLFVPTFFIYSGANFDLGMLSQPQTQAQVLLFLALFLLVRGLPTLLYRDELTARERWGLAFYSATCLPIVLAIAQIGASSGRMLHQNAVALVGAAVLSVLIFPILADRIKGAGPAASSLPSHRSS
jgi:Kef-type K+ transport system membrane component KefB